MAGAGYKLFNTGDVLTAAQVNTYLQEQTVMVFASSAARTSALTGVLAEGMMSYLQDTNAVEVYNGSSWVNVGNAGDITEVQAGVGISIASGTGPIPVITNSSTDLITTAGDILYGTAADTVARLGIGTAGQVLKVNSGATAPEWGAAGGGGMTSIATGTLASAVEGASITSIAGTYNHLQLILYNYTFSQDGYLTFRFNSDSGSNYQFSHQDFNASGTSDDYNTDATTGAYFNYVNPADATGSGYVVIFNIYNYANTTYHKHFFMTGSDLSYDGSPKVSRTVNGRWLSNSAITSLQIRTEGSPTTFAGGSYILYGVK